MGQHICRQILVSLRLSASGPPTAGPQDHVVVHNHLLRSHYCNIRLCALDTVPVRQHQRIE